MNEDLDVKAFDIFNRTSQIIIDEVKRNVVSHGINPTEFAVLKALYQKGRQTIQQVGQTILHASGSMTYIIDKLENKGLILRKECLSDRRAIYVAITEQGISFMDQVFPRYQKLIKQVFRAFSNEEKNELIHLLSKVGIQRMDDPSI